MIRKRTVSVVIGAFAVAGTMGIGLPLCAADDIYVTTTTDTNDGFCGGPVQFPCSLRDAILVANAHPGFDVIHVPPGAYDLTIGGVAEDGGMTGDLDILEEVMITGNSAASTIIDAQDLDRVFHVRHTTGGWVYLYDLTIRGGDSSSDPSSAHGAGVSSLGGATWIERCTVEDNETDSGHGGGLYQRQGTMAVAKTTVQENHAHGGSGLAAYLATVGIERSTFSDNYATDFDLTGTGGTVWLADSDGSIRGSTVANNDSRLTNQPAGIFVHGGSLEITNCTLFNNDGDEIFCDPATLPAPMELANSIIFGTCNEIGITTLGGNVHGPGVENSCMLGMLDLGARPIPLHPLGNYGGPTPTMPPVGGMLNAIIDNPNADPLCLSPDQRGIFRPQDGHGYGVAVCDSGAVEYRGLIFGDGFETGTTIRWDGSTE